MLPVWLVIISLADPLAKPELVAPMKTMDDCVLEANSGNTRGVMPLYRREPLPKGKAFLCMKFTYTL